MRARAALLLVLAASISLLLQTTMGRLTIHRADLAERRALVHEAIVTNTPPPGGWHANGLNGVNVRIVTPLLAELARDLPGVSLRRAYILIDTIALFFIPIVLFLFLRRWVPVEYCVIGILYVAISLIPTYLFQWFHPWDRLLLLAWILLLLLLQNGRLVPFAFGTAIGVGIKYDLVLIPGLYWLSAVTPSSWRRPTSIAAVLFAISFGTAGLLRFVLFPGGFDKYDELGAVDQVIHQVTHNWNVMLEHGIAFPPLLVFALPGVLGLRGLWGAPRFVAASFAFGVMLVVPFFLLSNFVEVRAHMASLVLMMPSALLGLRSLAGSDQDELTGKEETS